MFASLHIANSGSSQKVSNYANAFALSGRHYANMSDRPGNYLKAWREHRGLTQQQLADKLDTDKAVISLLENGKRRLDDRWLQRLADVLDTSRGNLLDHPPQDQMAEIIDLFVHVDQQDRQRFIGVAESLRKFSADE